MPRMKLQNILLLFILLFSVAAIPLRADDDEVEKSKDTAHGYSMTLPEDYQDQGPPMYEPSVEKSGGTDTAHGSYMTLPLSEDEPEEDQTPTKTVMAHTWPFGVPVNAPENYEEQPEQPHAEENAPPELPEPSR